MTQEQTNTIEAVQQGPTIIVDPDIVFTLSFTAFCQLNGIYSDRKGLHEFVQFHIEGYDHEIGLSADRWLEVWMDYNRWGRDAMIERFEDGDDERHDPHLDAFV